MTTAVEGKITGIVLYTRETDSPSTIEDGAFDRVTQWYGPEFKVPFSRLIQDLGRRGKVRAVELTEGKGANGLVLLISPLLDRGTSEQEKEIMKKGFDRFRKKTTNTPSVLAFGSYKEEGDINTWKMGFSSESGLAITRAALLILRSGPSQEA